MAGESRSLAEKSAAIISLLGADDASIIFKLLRESEIEQLSVELARMPKFKGEELDEVAKEFTECCMARKIITEGGMDYAKDVLERAFGAQQANSLMERVGRTLKTQAFGFLRKVDYKSLMTVIQNEHPQTLALILSYANAEQASQIIASLPRMVRVDVVERIANMERAQPQFIRIVENVVEGKLDTTGMADMMEVGGLHYIADIMNHVDRGTERDIFDELTVKNPELADNVRKLMFVFEDIAYLDTMSIQRFIREVDSKDLAVALKAANEEVVNAIFSNMSSRMRDSIRTDMEYLKNIRMRDVEEAQQRVVAAIRRLEEEGEVVISKDGKDDILV